MGKNSNNSGLVADTLFNYLRDVIYNPASASLNIKELPEEFRDLGKGLQYFSNCIIEATTLAKEMARGNLNCALPPPGNELAASLKTLHSSLKHLTWQTQQVAKGDYSQRVDFMGDFSEAFNNMIVQLDERWQVTQNEKTRLKRNVELILTNCPDPILLFDKQNRLSYVSSSFIALCSGATFSGVVGKHVSELFTPFVPEGFSQHIESMFNAAVIKNHTENTRQYIDFRQNGNARHYQLQVTPMLAENGKTDGVLLFMHDITELTRSKELAERSSRAKSEFLARMSHEMRTPMNAVLGMTAVYGASRDPEKRDYCVKKIGDASRHLLGVINDILDMSNIDADKFTLTPGKLDFKKMIDRIIEAFKFKVEIRKQNFTVKIADTIPQFIVADEQRLSQTISNILSNAVKFTHDGGDIFFTAENVFEDEHTCSIQFTVKDNGIGISKERQSALFSPFEQADGGVARKYDGTGLGLIIAKRIAEMMGGSITIDSEPGKGSSFVLEVTVKKAGTEVENDNIPEDGLFAGRNILLAEDVEINREIILSLLEHTDAGFITATDGAEAFETYAADPEFFDLILMDINMPVMDGYNATRCIRNSGLPGSDIIPIIALTANMFQEDIDKCLDSGMDGHIGKPVDAGKLIAQLKKHLL